MRCVLGERLIPTSMVIWGFAPRKFLMFKFVNFSAFWAINSLVLAGDKVYTRTGLPKNFFSVLCKFHSWPFRQVMAQIPICCGLATGYLPSTLLVYRGGVSQTHRPSIRRQTATPLHDNACHQVKWAFSLIVNQSAISHHLALLIENITIYESDSHGPHWL